MKIKFIRPSQELEIVGSYTGLDIIKHIERAGRTCYKSEEKITEDSASKFVKMIINSKHDSVLEHFSFSIRFICDRGVTHEMVRHRIASFSQESTRYVGYGDAIQFIIPNWCENIYPNDNVTKASIDNSMTSAEQGWAISMIDSATTYSKLLDLKWKPQQARSVLPNSLKTEIVMTCNLREWRHVFNLRGVSKAAHPQIREVMIPALEHVKQFIPVVFDDLIVD